MEKYKNSSYIFIPLKFMDQSEFRPLVNSLKSSKMWEEVKIRYGSDDGEDDEGENEIKYMLKFVADNISNEDENKRRCFHYILKDEGRAAAGLGSRDEWWCSSGKKEHLFHGNPANFPFQITDVHLYCFSTTVCIIAFRLHFEQNDPMWISSAQYYLKKVSRETITSVSGEVSDTILNISRSLMTEPVQAGVCSFDFFYYANPGTERANLFTYIETESNENYERDLFYLRHCYHDQYAYSKDEQADSEEIYVPSPNTMWGLSPEAAACLVCRTEKNKNFIDGTFYINFNSKYLFMYILLLHQKYALYMFLMKVDSGDYKNYGDSEKYMEELEKYRKELYEFEADFVFACVTEVPQYQNLYDRMSRIFALRKMYEDVHEPIISLGETRKVITEAKQKKRDERMNTALLMLSLLSLFSALIDSFDFADSIFGWFMGESEVVVRGLQLAFIAIISVIVGISIKNLITIRKD